ncbi:hypothetical protein H012_gp258 [Acanthamoeba polyphaga moumouvirus]|uniref:Uncharacterized protein n=1 Tax=Acanthamoeba polyphaga moumouvirus TaxID=1269028 RepID=L7RGI5_9VIRU|nr:hypothetical protein H012_gp258 [Acanthamoeba polyphaga moumouvirus]AGC02195.1 hypothetical protein Moumou_00673 [Acanthamoeba polyphaga moumouvirus]
MDIHKNIMQELKYFDFDLDKPSDSIWQEIFDHYEDYIPTLKKKLNEVLEPYSSTLSYIKLLPGLVNKKMLCIMMKYLTYQKE